MNIRESKADIDINWIDETSHILLFFQTKDKHRFSREVPKIRELISSQIKKLPHFETTKTRNTVDSLHKILKASDSNICSIFFSTFVHDFMQTQANLSLLPDEIKIQMARSEIMPEFSQAIMNHSNIGDAIEKVTNKYNIDKTSPKWQLAILEIFNYAISENQNLGLHLNGYETTNVTARDVLIQINQAIAQKDPKIALKFMGYEIKITEKEVLLNALTLIVHKDIEGIAKNFQNLKITDSSVLKEITQFIAKEKPSLIAKNIENFKILDQEIIIEIAQLMAEENPEELVKNINKYQITDDEVLVELAEEIGKKEPNLIAEHILNFGITAEEGLIDIAYLLAHKAPHLLVENIENFRIIEQQTMGEIAQFIAEKQPKLIVENIKNFQITDQQILTRIALFIAEKEPRLIGENIKNFKITDQKLRVEIAKILAPIQPDVLVENIGDFEITEQKAFVEIVLIIAQYYPDEILDYIFKLKLDHKKVEDQQTLILMIKTLITKMATKYAIDKSTFKLVEKRLKDPPWDNPLEQIRLWDWMMTIFIKCSQPEFISEFFIKQQPLIFQISKLEPRLRYSLTEIYLNLSLEPEQKDSLEEFQRLMKDTSKEEEISAHIQLSILLFATLPSKGKIHYENALKTIKDLRNDLRIGQNQRLLIETLLKIKDNSLKDEQYLTLINMLFESNVWKPDNFQLVRDLLNFKAEDYMNTFTNFNDLKIILEKVFQDRFGIKINNFSTRYEKTIGTWRNKEALMTYASKLNDLYGNEKTQADQFIKQLLEMILEERFEKERYLCLNNPHMKEIKENYPVVYDQWQKNVELDPVEMKVSSNQTPVSVENEIKTRIKQALINKHLGGDKQAISYPYLTACIGNWEKVDEQLNHVKNLLEPYKGRRLSKNEVIIKAQLATQEAILKILTSSDWQKKTFNNLKSLVNEEEFSNDIQGCIKLLDLSLKPSEESPKYRVIDSDDPNHFLLMGTEVYNSCQRVDGDVRLNKCLLGYFLDGKHRLALVCDPSGKILARSVLRLLLNDEGHPVLFQERLYVADSSPEYKELIRKLAIKKAQSLKIPLVVSKYDFSDEQGPAYSFDLYAKDKPVPFEYVDALGGPQSDVYRLHKDSIILVKN